MKKKICKTIFTILLVLALALAVSVPKSEAADRENFSVGVLTVLKEIGGAAFRTVSKVMTASTNWTLTKAQALCTFVKMTACGCGDSAIVPTAYLKTGDMKIVRNETDDSVTFKAYGQTGVSIASGKTAILIYDGTDYRRVTADATH